MHTDLALTGASDLTVIDRASHREIDVGTQVDDDLLDTGEQASDRQRRLFLRIWRF
jgi:hypothetical protein